MGRHVPGFLKLLLGGHLYVCELVCTHIETTYHPKYGLRHCTCKVHVSKINSLLSKLSKVEATALHPVLSISACFIILGPQHSVHPSRTVVRSLSVYKILYMSIQSYVYTYTAYTCSYACMYAHTYE